MRRVGGRVIQVPITFGDCHTKVKFGGFAHLLELVRLGLVEFLNPLRIRGNATNGQILLRHVNHAVDLILVGDKKNQVVFVGTIFLHRTFVLEEFDHQIRRSRSLGRLHMRCVVMQHNELRELGIVVNASRLSREISRRENAFPPDFLDAVVKFALRFYFTDEAHLIIDNLPKRWLGLEAITEAVVVEEPATINQALHGLLDQSGIVIRLEDRKPKVGWIDAALPGLHETVQEGGRRNTPGVGGAASIGPFKVDLLSVRKRALLWARNIGLDYLAKLGAIKPTGQVVGDLFVAQIQIVRTDKEKVLRFRLPQVANSLREKSEKSARLLKIRNSRGFAI